MKQSKVSFVRCTIMIGEAVEVDDPMRKGIKLLVMGPHITMKEFTQTLSRTPEFENQKALGRFGRRQRKLCLIMGRLCKDATHWWHLAWNDITKELLENRRWT